MACRTQSPPGALNTHRPGASSTEKILQPLGCGLPQLRPRTERNKRSSPKAALRPADLLKVARAQQPGLHSALDFEKAPDLQALVSWVPQRLGRDVMGIGGGNPAPWCASSRRTGAAFTDEAQSQPSATHSRCSPTSTRNEGTAFPLLPPTQALLLQASGSQQTDVLYGEYLLTTCFHVLHFFPIQPCTPITHLLGQGRREDALRLALPPVSSQPRELGARSTTPLFPRGPEAAETELGGRHSRSPSSQPGPKASSVPPPHAFKKRLNLDLPDLVLLGAG